MELNARFTSPVTVNRVQKKTDTPYADHIAKMGVHVNDNMKKANAALQTQVLKANMQAEALRGEKAMAEKALVNVQSELSAARATIADLQRQVREITASFNASVVRQEKKEAKKARKARTEEPAVPVTGEAVAE